MQYSYCYLAKASDKQGNATLSESEIQLGMVVEWMTLDKALEVMNDSFQQCEDYSSRFMIIRDKTILEEAVHILSGA